MSASTKVKVINFLSDVASVGIKATGFFLAFIFAAGLISLDVYGEIAPFLAPLVIIPVAALVITFIAGAAAILMTESITE